MQRPPAGGQNEPDDRLIRRTWLLFAVSFGLFAVVLLVSRIADGVDAWDLVIGGLLALVGAAAGLYHMAVRDRARIQRDEMAGFARILRGLSRSVSPDAIVGAIARELGDVAGADHVVVVRRPPDSTFVEATLVSMRPGVQDVTTVLTGAALDDETDWSALPDDAALVEDRRRPVGDEPIAIPIARSGGQAAIRESVAIGVAAGAVAVADRARATIGRADRLDRAGGAHLGARVRSAFGLARTIAAPLRADGRVVGAIVLSRRWRRRWRRRRRRSGPGHDRACGPPRPSRRCASRRSGPERLRTRPDHRSAAPRRRPRRRGDRPVTPRARALVAVGTAAARSRRRRGLCRAVAGVLLPTGPGKGDDGRPDRAPQSGLLRRALRAPFAAPPGRRVGRRPDDRPRPLQGAQRSLRTSRR